MKNYYEFHGIVHKTSFDPLTKCFVTRPVPSHFQPQRDALEAHLLADIGVDAAALDLGYIKIAA